MKLTGACLNNLDRAAMPQSIDPEAGCRLSSGQLTFQAEYNGQRTSNPRPEYSRCSAHVGPLQTCDERGAEDEVRSSQACPIFVQPMMPETKRE